MYFQPLSAMEKTVGTMHASNTRLGVAGDSPKEAKCWEYVLVETTENTEEFEEEN